MENLIYKIIDKDEELTGLISKWQKNDVNTIAMDFEEESNLHVYGEYICTIQIFDSKNYYLIDALSISKTVLKNFLENDIEKIMFSCESDAAIARKTLSAQLNNIYDVRVIAVALGFMGNLTGLIKRNLNIEITENKKKFQKTNWMNRPLSEEQIQYALGDVTYLFDLKISLETELAEKEDKIKKTVAYKMRNCAKQKNPEKPGWEKICNWKRTPQDIQIYIKEFFIARDNIARKLNKPASHILSKQAIIKMAYAKNYFHSQYDKEFKEALNKAKVKEQKWN